MEDLKFSSITYTDRDFDVAIVGAEVYIIGSIDICGAVAKPKISLYDFTKATEDPRWANYIPAKVKRGKNMVNLIPVPLAVAFWQDQAYKGNNRAKALLEAAAITDFTESALRQNGVIRDEKVVDAERTNRLICSLRVLNGMVDKHKQLQENTLKKHRGTALMPFVPSMYSKEAREYLECCNSIANYEAELTRLRGHSKTVTEAYLELALERKAALELVLEP